MSEHSSTDPVTWEVHKVQEHPDDFAFLQIHQDGVEIAHVYHHPDKYTEAERHANLLAAAPQLLALARRYAGECAECGGSGEEIVDDDMAVPCDACEDIRAVIDKAEGRS